MSNRTRWKMKSELVEHERELVLALYDADKMPLQRHVMRFGEYSSQADVAAKLRSLADEIEKGAP